MKKVLLCYLIVFASNAYAEAYKSTEFEKDELKEANVLSREAIQTTYGVETFLHIVCVDGYKFILTADQNKRLPVNTTQMFEEKNGVSVPSKCD